MNTYILFALIQLLTFYFLHFSTLAWKIPWTEEPGGLQSMESLRVGHDWVTSLSLFTFMHWRRKWQPTPVFLLENPRDGGAWWAGVYGVAQSQTRLKWLSLAYTHLYTTAQTYKLFIFLNSLKMTWRHHDISYLDISVYISYEHSHSPL